MKGHKIRLLAILLLFGILLCGCGLQNHVYTETGLKKVAEKSLKKKYNEEFVIHNVWSKNQDVFYADCSPKNNAEIVFRADVYKNGKGVSADGYVQGVVAEQINDILKSGFAEVFGECYTKGLVAFYHNEPNFKEINNITIQKYTEKSNLGFMVYYVFVDGRNLPAEDGIDREYIFLSETVKETINRNSAKDIINDFTLVIWFLDEEMLKACKEYYSMNATSKGDFSMELEKNPKFICSYSNGTMQQTYDDYEAVRLNKNENRDFQK